MYQICFGEADNLECDEEFKYMLVTTRDFSDFVNAGNPVDMMPWLRFVFKDKTKRFFDLVERAEVFRKKKIAEHKETFNGDHLRDIADGLISAYQSIPDSERKELGLTEEQIMSTLDNVFGAGFDTTSNVLSWAILLLASFPDIQQRVYEEICDVIGSSNRPCLSHKSKMPYTEATTAEILRYSGLLVLAVPHYTTTDTKVGGYEIPKSTVVLLNMYSITHDEDLWGDPHIFRPDRFLDDEGQLVKAILDRFIPFSSGRRRCLAEFFARLEIFLLLTGLLQLCVLEKPDEDEGNMDPVFEQSLRPKPYMLIVKAR